MLNKMPGLPTRSIYDVQNKTYALSRRMNEMMAEDSRAAKEARVVTIRKYETFLYELHSIVKRVQCEAGVEYSARVYPELERFLEEHSK